MTLDQIKGDINFEKETKTKGKQQTAKKSPLSFALSMKFGKENKKNKIGTSSASKMSIKLSPSLRVVASCAKCQHNLLN